MHEAAGKVDTLDLPYFAAARGVLFVVLGRRKCSVRAAGQLRASRAASSVR